MAIWIVNFIEQRDLMIDIDSLGPKQVPKVGLEFYTNRKSIFYPPPKMAAPRKGWKKLTLVFIDGF